MEYVLHYLDDLLHLQPVLMLFLVIGMGYLLGNVRLGTFSFGPVAGVLFAGLFLGHFGLRINPAAQAVGFAMFIFSVGYQAGPRFFVVLKQDGLKYFILAVVVGSVGFAVAALGATLLHMPDGASAGLLAGGLTSSPTLAAAQEAVRSKAVPVPSGMTADELIGNISTAYAITYIFGLAGLISLVKLLPGWMGIDLAAEAQRYAQGEASMDESPAVNITVRTYQVTNEAFTEPTMAQIRDQYWDHVTVAKVMRQGKVMHLKDEDHLLTGDTVELIGPRQFFTEVAQHIGDELPQTYDISETIESAQIVVTGKEFQGQTLRQLNIPANFGLTLVRVKQLGVEIPVSADLALQKGDILTVSGPTAQLNALGETLGEVERDISETDMVTFSFGIVAGVIFGLFSVKVGGVSIGLGSAGGLLLSGLLIGYLRSLRPTFGRMPDAARWFLMEFGLLLFMAGVGLQAGGNFIATILSAGPSLIAVGVFVTSLPILIGYWFGRKVLKISHVLLFGAITGAMTSGAALGVVTGAAKSSVPALGYTGTYAFANVLLMVAGSVILLV